MSQKRIAPVVLLKRPADNEAGGSGAAGQSQNKRLKSDLASCEIFFSLRHVSWLQPRWLSTRFGMVR